MPEGDTIFRSARTLNRALAGRTVTAFESVYPAIVRVDLQSRDQGTRAHWWEHRSTSYSCQAHGDERNEGDGSSEANDG